MTDLLMLGNSFCEFGWYRRTKDLVPLFDPKVHIFENSILKMLSQLLCSNLCFYVGTPQKMPLSSNHIPCNNFPAMKTGQPCFTFLFVVILPSLV